jgi:hypothetical protein
MEAIIQIDLDPQLPSPDQTVAGSAPHRTGASRRLFFAFSFSVYGGAGVYMPGFRSLGKFRFCFFNSFWSGKKKAVRSGG